MLEDSALPQCCQMLEEEEEKKKEQNMIERTARQAEFERQRQQKSDKFRNQKYLEIRKNTENSSTV